MWNNVGVTVSIAEVTSVCGRRSDDGIAVLLCLSACLLGQNMVTSEPTTIGSACNSQHWGKSGVGTCMPASRCWLYDNLVKYKLFLLKWPS